MPIVMVGPGSSRDSVRITTETGGSFFTRGDYLRSAGGPPDVAGAMDRVAGASIDAAACAADMPATAVRVELTDDAIAALSIARAAYEAERRALALVTRAEQTRFLLARKLEARGIPRDAAALALDRLERAGLVDDERFASMWVQARIRRRAEGRDSLIAALAARGVAQEVARRVVGAFWTDDVRLATLVRAARKACRSIRFDPARFTRKMMVLGYRRSEIVEVLAGLDLD